MNDQKDILDKIIQVSNITKDDDILEIGPGQGALTALLLQYAHSVTAVEIDTDLVPILQDRFSHDPNFDLVVGDFIEKDIKSYLDHPKVKVVANIPYYITSPIINKLIQNRDKVTDIYIMVQKEVAERICASKGKDRSILTLAIEFFGKANYLFTIPKEAFTPVPKVDSAFISISLYKDPIYTSQVDEEIFFKFIKVAFSSKRKTIVNNLTGLGISKDQVRELLDHCEIQLNERAENITIEKYINLINIYQGEKYAR